MRLPSSLGCWRLRRLRPGSTLPRRRRWRWCGQSLGEREEAAQKGSVLGLGSSVLGLRRRELVWLRWGLVPSWAKDAEHRQPVDQRPGETAAEKPAFRAAMRRRRCLVVADGFYEWRRAGRSKQPYFIRLHDDRPFGFAGLWEAWEGPAIGVLETCTVLTTAANDLVRPMHDRMPVILAPEGYASWLDPAVEDPRQLTPLLVPYPSEAMEAYPVSPLVNKPAHDSPRCIEPAEGSLF